MAVSTGTAILAGSAISAGAGILGGNKAADAQKDAANASIAEQRRQFDYIQQIMAPFRTVGYGALNTLASAYIPGWAGMTVPMPGGGTRRLGPIRPGQLENVFQNLPGVRFAQREAIRGVGNSYAARGGAYGGNALAEIGDRSSNMAMLATMPYLQGLAGVGQQSAGQLANSALATGRGVSDALGYAGDARASGYMNQYGSINNAVQGGLQNWLLYQAMNQAPGSMGSVPFNPYGYSGGP